MARLWNYFQRQDQFPKIVTWPQWTADAALKAHKNNRELYDLFKFYVGNGLYPPTAIIWIKASDCVNDKILSGNYDRDAMRQLRRFLSRSNNRDFWESAVYYDLNLKRTVRGNE